MIKNKKALSEIVAVVLIILITVAATFALGEIIIPFVRNNLYQSTECSQYQSYFSFSQKFVDSAGNSQFYNCYSPDKIYTGFSVTAQAGENISSSVKGFQITIFNDVSSSSVQITNQGVSPAGSVLAKDPSITIGSPGSIPSNGETITYVYTNPSDLTATPLKRMEIRPILSSGKICGKTDSINLVECNGVTLP